MPSRESALSTPSHPHDYQPVSPTLQPWGDDVLTAQVGSQEWQEREGEACHESQAHPESREAMGDNEPVRVALFGQRCECCSPNAKPSAGSLSTRLRVAPVCLLVIR